MLLSAFCVFCEDASSQARDLSAQRLVLDDNNNDGNGFQTVTIDAPALSTNQTASFPDASGTILLSPSGGFADGGILFGDSAGTLAQTSNLIWNDSAGRVEIAGDVLLTGSDLQGIETVEGMPGENVYITSYGSIINNLDDNDDGSGSTFSIETNGSSDDLFSVTETGLTTIRSTSGSGGLRVNNSHGSSTTNILELTDGTDARLVVRRDGNVGIGTDPAARLDVWNSSSESPTLRIANEDSAGVAMQIDEGILALSFGSGTSSTIPRDVSIWLVEENGLPTGVDVELPTAQPDGTVLIVLYDDAECGTLSSEHILPGESRSFVRANGEWWRIAGGR
jgi:hypothetical protein